MTTYINPAGWGGSNTSSDEATEGAAFLAHRPDGDPDDTGYVQLQTRGSGPGWIDATFGPATVSEDAVITVGIVWVRVYVE